jgi:hypothetical protein
MSSLMIIISDFCSSQIGNNTSKEFTKMCPPNDPLVSVSNLDKVTIVRFAADSTEDAYRLLAEILKPLSSGLLHELLQPYADRIHSLKKNIVPDTGSNTHSANTADVSDNDMDTANTNNKDDHSNDSMLSINQHNCNIEGDNHVKRTNDINLIRKKRSLNDIEYDNKNYDEANVGSAIAALLKYDKNNNFD